ncbi:transcriptional regulator, RpiR family [Novosphingobium aromaticivorans DSM 12444]|uniref:Transcriptional regulator, RpiR family n=2 Tax=Novosphingobium aromaticivorans TaxID=48935 RepID=Q2G836_NOVAD|nr:MurR/RpiR family transcriptional regulator [Novosphingobium aromaticivorans]ABD25987.1 transcriptional regulator, RpiR family [Novosphingobium aromaticivorans DSM 12444]SCY62105.1 transcriptional regulator, RpiR family [Novosphingobium aromaticivorans]
MPSSPQSSVTETAHLPVENALTRIRSALPQMSKTAAKIAAYVVEHPADVVGMSITDLAALVDASEGSVINFCRSIGLGGFQHLKLSLAQEIVQPVHFIHEDLEREDSTETVCRKVFHSGIQALRDSLSVLDPKAMAAAVDIIRAARRVEIYGIGSSAPIAEDAHYRLLRIGLDARVVIDSHVQAISASRCDKDVAVLTISHSGSTNETVAATRLAHEAGARTIVITNFGRSPIQAYADVVLFTMARETRFRTEAMTSRIAQLCVIDALIAALALADYDRSTDVLKQTFDVLSIKRF